MQRAVHYMSPHETRSFRADGAGLLPGDAPPGSQLIDRPLLGDDAGLMGAVLLAIHGR